MKDINNSKFSRFSACVNIAAQAYIWALCAFFALVALSLNTPVYGNTEPTDLLLNKRVLTLQTAIELAKANDPWLRKSQSVERSFQNKSAAAGALPDPIMSFQLGNMPVNSFDFNQEAMTQIQVGIAQMLPRGDSLAINQRYQNALSKQYPLYRVDRNAQTTLQVSIIWLEAFNAQASVNLIENNKALFEQLGEIVQVSYSSLVGNVKQQDIIRAELELTKIEDRLIQLTSRQENAKAQLQQWIQSESHNIGNAFANIFDFRLPPTLYDLPALPLALKKPLEHNKHNVLATLVANHPAVKVIEQSIVASQSAIDLAKQQYKPQWQLNASYAYRQDDMLGASRSDLLSIGASVSLPLFSDVKPDSEVSVAINQSQALITEKRLVMRDLISKLNAAMATYKGLLERHSLYTKSVIPQMQQQAQSSLNGYTNDTSDFTEVVRDKIAELDAKITLIDIETDMRKTMANIQYFLTDTAYSKDSANAY